MSVVASKSRLEPGDDRPDGKAVRAHRAGAMRQAVDVLDALRWPLLNVNVHVSGLVERALGSRLFAVAGRTSSQAVVVNVSR